jgi:Flp pilus assembly protein TadD
MRLDPTRPESYQALGDIAMQLGDPNAASRYYLAGLENTVPTANMLNNLGMAQLALAQYDDALQSLALALALEPDAIRIRNNLARVEREIQQQDLQRDKQ